MTKLTSVMLTELRNHLGDKFFDEAYAEAVTTVGPKASLEFVLIIVIKKLLAKILALEAKVG